MFAVVLILLLTGRATVDEFWSAGANSDTANITYSNTTGFGVFLPTCHLNVGYHLDDTWSCLSNNKSCYAQCLDVDFYPNLNGNMSNNTFSTAVNASVFPNCEGFCIPEKNVSCEIILCDQHNITIKLEKLKNQHAPLEGLKRILNVKKMCPSLFKDLEFVDVYLSVEKSIINSVIRNTLLSNSSVEHDLEDIVMTVASGNCSKQGNVINVTSPVIAQGHSPVKILIPMEAFIHATEDQQKSAVVHYRSPQQFLIGQDVMLVSRVIRVEVLGEPPKKLKDPLRMTLTVDVSNYSLENQTFSCQYYNDSTLKNGSRWSSGGCKVKSHSNMAVDCSCDHMTPFAVLLIPELNLDAGHWTILSYISYVGCGLSAFFSGISILTYFILIKVRTDSSAAIHSSLSAALLLLNVSFLLSQWAANQQPHELCVCIAVAIEYALLSTFSWLAVEGLHLYLMLIRVFNIYYTHYLLKLSLIGWGVPAVVVSVSLAVKVDIYGRVTAQETHYCWITDKAFGYGMNLTFYSLVFLLNSGILLMVSARILRPWQPEARARPARQNLTCRNLLTILGLTGLLGSTWGLAFLSNEYTSHIILYLFCILNSLQGFFLFLWVYGTLRKERQKHTPSTSTVLDSLSTSKSQEFFPGKKLS